MTLAIHVDKRTKKVRVRTEDSDDEEAEDKDLAMIIKTMKKFWKKEENSRNSRGNSSRGSSRDSSSRDLKDVTCYNCQEKGHYSSGCPKKEEQETPGKRKSMVVASWGESDSDAEEMNTKCLMANDEVKEILLRQSVLLCTMQHLKYIIDDQRE